MNQASPHRHGCFSHILGTGGVNGHHGLITATAGIDRRRMNDSLGLQLGHKPQNLLPAGNIEQDRLAGLDLLSMITVAGIKFEAFGRPAGEMMAQIAAAAGDQ